ncbi:GTP cyclohydrolase I [Frankia casuarinae]|jgi:GTP cyclohydrolase I|uniref:GTP cyclohydrolase 1 n=1 Tax=Frankia casuarinae (strain DSM 45818 / CECT 9043 / HFP020203 / CcI3) TaxID=106370 RepID=Q2JC68_FRACC|nr:GTP cyclohydrolase I [Frankia casuarinae]ABD11124.1 GTP cyclohydrolase I [Frankia casuarinae]EYT90895.1 GTP cyclohydrolase I [Frankia casuarinae]
MSLTYPDGRAGLADEVADGTDPLEGLARQLLVEIGEDPGRDGLRETPARYARWWREFVGFDPGNTETAFEQVNHGQLVQVNDIRVWSLCEHHLLPFWCDISIAYLAKDKLLGLSKFARIAHHHAHRLQVQERLTGAIADAIEALCGVPDVAVRAKGEHLCMTMRGIRSPATMSTLVLRGVFKDDPHMRNLLS